MEGNTVSDIAFICGKRYRSRMQYVQILFVSHMGRRILTDSFQHLCAWCVNADWELRICIFGKV